MPAVYHHHLHYELLNLLLVICYWCFRETYCLHLQGRPRSVSCFTKWLHYIGRGLVRQQEQQTNKRGMQCGVVESCVQPAGGKDSGCSSGRIKWGNAGRTRTKCWWKQNDKLKWMVRDSQLRKLRKKGWLDLFDLTSAKMQLLCMHPAV